MLKNQKLFQKKYTDVLWFGYILWNRLNRDVRNPLCKTVFIESYYQIYLILREYDLSDFDSDKESLFHIIYKRNTCLYFICWRKILLFIYLWYISKCHRQLLYNRNAILWILSVQMSKSSFFLRIKYVFYDCINIRHMIILLLSLSNIMSVLF